MAAKHRKTRALLAALAAAAALLACPATALAADEQLSVEVTPTVPCHVKADGSVMTADASAWAITNKGADEVTVSKVSAAGGAGADAADVAVKAKVRGADWFSYQKGAFAEPASELSVPGNGSINAQWEIAGKLDPSANADILKQAATPQGYDLVAFSFTFAPKQKKKAFAITFINAAGEREARLYNRADVPKAGELFDDGYGDGSKKVLSVYNDIENKPSLFVNSSIETVTVVDSIQPSTTSQWFANCKTLSKIEGLNNLNTSNVTDMSAMFNNCSSLSSLDVSGFDTSKVTSMNSMFAWCSGLSSLDVSGFDTGNVTDMRSMFNECFRLASLDVSGFDTGNVTDMSAMFSDYRGLSSLDVSGFDTSSVTNMKYMFNNCIGLSSLDVSGFNTGNVTNMGCMFDGCSGLSSLDVSGFDTSKVTSMNSMFAWCSGLSSLDVSGFDTSNVTNMQDMFSGCSGLSSLDVSGFDTGNVTNMGGMFSGCKGLASLDLSTWKTKAVNIWESSSYLSLFLQGVPLQSVKLTGANWSESGIEQFKGLNLFAGNMELTYQNVRDLTDALTFSKKNQARTPSLTKEDAEITEAKEMKTIEGSDSVDRETTVNDVVSPGIDKASTTIEVSAPQKPAVSVGDGSCTDTSVDQSDTLKVNASSGDSKVPAQEKSEQKPLSPLS